jgi:hypothetical protein
VAKTVERLARKLKQGRKIFSLATLVACAHLLAALSLAFGYDPTAIFSKAELDSKSSTLAEPAKAHQQTAEPSPLAAESEASLAPEISAEPAATAELAPFAEPISP